MSPDPSSIHLRRTEENTPAIDAMAERLGQKVGVAGLLAELNRLAERARVPGAGVEHGFRWNAEDCANDRWWPQGITTSADASDTEDVEGRRLLVTSWYSKTLRGTNLGSRVTVVDLDTLAYRHVLLVVPGTSPDGAASYEPLLAHAGGLVWWGPHLHVAGTRRGLFACRVEDIIRLRSTEDSFGYRFVLPVRFAYDAYAGEGTERFRYSFLSLDRTSRPPHLVVGEYGRAQMTSRLVRYRLDIDTPHLTAQEDGTARPLSPHESGPGHMQGAAVVDGTYYVTVSRGRHRLGHLYVGEPGRFRPFPRALPVGPEDITYWPSTDLLWSLSEYPGHRYVFALRRAAFD